MMLQFKSYFKVALLSTFLGAFIQCENHKYDKIPSICRLLEAKFAASNPWTDYPIVYEPIVRGRLTIWTGSSNLPTSEFACYPAPNSTDEMILHFASFASKLEWSFFDRSKGLTHHGFSIEHEDNVEYKVGIVQRKNESYLECDVVGKIEKIETNTAPHVTELQTVCPECSRSVFAMIDRQVEQLIKRRLNDQLIDNLSWHLAHLTTTQHFNSPTPLLK